MTDSPINILVVEDSPRWSNIYADILSDGPYVLEVVTNYGEARGLLQRTPFALAIIDIQLASSEERQDNQDGWLLLESAKQRGVRSIVVSTVNNPERINHAYDALGVFAFIEKSVFDRKSFARLVNEALALPSVVTPLGNIPQLADLTDREREVLLLMTQGHTNREIGERLQITPNTVKKHVDHILQKLRVNNRSGAVAAAMKAGLGN